MNQHNQSGDIDESDDTGSFTISIYSGDSGRLLREIIMDAQADDISCIEEAEQKMCSELASCSFANVVVVITEEESSALNQIQVQVAAQNSNA